MTVINQQSKRLGPRNATKIYANSPKQARTKMVSRFAKEHEEYENGKQIKLCLKPFGSEINLQGTLGENSP